MQLYEVPKHSIVKIVDDEVTVAPASIVLKKCDVLWYGHIDGMYSFCTKKKKEGDGNEYVYPAAWTEVEVLEAKEDGKWHTDPQTGLKRWEERERWPY